MGHRSASRRCGRISIDKRACRHQLPYRRDRGGIAWSAWHSLADGVSAAPRWPVANGRRSLDPMLPRPEPALSSVAYSTRKAEPDWPFRIKCGRGNGVDVHRERSAPARLREPTRTTSNRELAFLHDQLWRRRPRPFVLCGYRAIGDGPTSRSGFSSATRCRARSHVSGCDWRMGRRRLFQRQYDNAISACQRSLELDPTYPWALRWLGEAYLLKGMHKEAVRTLNKIGTPVFGCGLLGWSYLKAGCRDRATQLLLDLEKQALPALACQRAILNLAFGHEEETFTQLWQACVARNVGVHWLKVDPIWDPLRSNPQFQEILHRMNL